MSVSNLNPIPIQSPTNPVYIQAIRHSLRVDMMSVFSLKIYTPAGSEGGFLGLEMGFPKNFPPQGTKNLEFDFLNWLFCFSGFDFWCFSTPPLFL